VPAPRFTRRERALVDRLRTPLEVQAWLNALPYNWERKGPTARTFRGVVARGTAHCFEAALSAACILEQHGFPPLLLDIESVHGRKPVFRTLDALVRSYVAPFIDPTGRVKGYGVLDLRALPTGAWRLAAGNVPHVEQALRDLRHKRFPTPQADYRKWKARFDQWWEAEGRPDHRWPDFYPGKRHWTASQ
jgi:hypothetical protein